MKVAEVPLLEVRDLSISFATESGSYRHAVKRLSFQVGRGEIVGLMGPSGSGKTTVALGLLGLLRGSPGVWEGEALLDGKPLLPPSGKYVREKIDGKIRKRENSFHAAQEKLLRTTRGRDIALIFQEPRSALDPYFSVGEHMLESLRRAVMKESSNPSRSAEELYSTGIEFLEDAGLVDARRLWRQFPHQLSGGMAQRVMIAMALCAKPKLLIADEPSTALDATTQAKLLELFHQLTEKYGLSILLISHDPHVIGQVCQRVYVLSQGALVETFSPSDPGWKTAASSGFLYASSLRRFLPANPAFTSSVSPLLHVQNLCKQFSKDGASFPALRGVSLRIEKGETYALVGESGSGKTTLALSILGLQEVDAGCILYNGEDVLKATPARRRNLRRDIRMLFQHPEAALNSGMTVFSILAEGLEKEGEFGRGEIRERVALALKEVHLKVDYARRHPANLSSGEKQRVAIARALITRPKLLVCDEPVASLDLAVQAHVLELLCELQERMGLAYLFISHNLEWVKRFSHRVGVMYQGEIVEEVVTQGFTLEWLSHPYSRLLLSSSWGGKSIQE